MAKKIKHEAQPDMFALLDHQLRTAHLPAREDWPGAVAFWRSLLERYNSAMLAGDTAAAIAIREEAALFREHVHGGSRGLSETSRKLWAATRAADGAVPMWGQSGTFTVTHGESLPVRVELDGLLCIGDCLGLLPWFSINIVEKHRLFFSPTGYRSCFSGMTLAHSGLTVDAAVRVYLDDLHRRELKGKLVPYQSDEDRAAGAAGWREKWEAEQEQRRAAGIADDDDEDDDEDADWDSNVCADCGVSLAQLDEYFECSEDGGMRCGGCHPAHAAVCPPCVAELGEAA